MLAPWEDKQWIISSKIAAPGSGVQRFDESWDRFLVLDSSPGLICDLNAGPTPIYVSEYYFFEIAYIFNMDP